jgi:hypothetical protein
VQSIDVKVQKALDCPCVADLKNGPCGGPFVDAFSCFLRSTEEEKVVFIFSCSCVPLLSYEYKFKVDFNLNVADKLTLNVYTSLIIIT